MRFLSRLLEIIGRQHDVSAPCPKSLHAGRPSVWFGRRVGAKEVAHPESPALIIEINPFMNRRYKLKYGLCYKLSYCMSYLIETALFVFNLLSPAFR